MRALRPSCEYFRILSQSSTALARSSGSGWPSAEAAARTRSDIGSRPVRSATASVRRLTALPASAARLTIWVRNGSAIPSGGRHRGVEPQRDAELVGPVEGAQSHSRGPPGCETGSQGPGSSCPTRRARESCELMLRLPRQLRLAQIPRLPQDGQPPVPGSLPSSDAFPSLISPPFRSAAHSFVQGELFLQERGARRGEKGAGVLLRAPVVYPKQTNVSLRGHQMRDASRAGTARPAATVRVWTPFRKGMSSCLASAVRSPCCFSSSPWRPRSPGPDRHGTKP